LALVGCSNSGPVQVTTDAPAGNALAFVIAACGARGSQVEVEESVRVVTLRATVEQHAGDSCASIRQVDLRVPLGDREVVDADTGDAIPRPSGRAGRSPSSRAVAPECAPPATD
jgi:hypothetical protein